MFTSEHSHPEQTAASARHALGSSRLHPHVVVASSGLGHVARGVETWAAALAMALHERGVWVTLCKGSGTAEAAYERVVRCWRRDSHKARVAARVLPRAIAWRLGLASTYGVEQVTFALRLIWMLRRERPDVLHVQDPLVAMLVQTARRLGVVSTRIILAHGTEEPLAFLAKIERVQHLAPEHERQCREDGVWRPEWTMIPNFVDTQMFSPGTEPSLREELGIPADALVVLTAAAIKRSHKRIDALIDECSRLIKAHPELPVWVVIAGGREADTDAMVALGQERLGERVKFLVQFPRQDMARLYRCADVFVLASLKEMMPIALLEACASGLPCVVNDDPVLRWMTGPGGIARQMARSGELADGLAQVLCDASLRNRLAESARRHSVDNFGRDAVVDRVLEYYREVAPGPEWQTRGTAVAGRDSHSRRVSVIIPTFNSAAWVVEAVDSVLSQTASPHEIVVVDDGSTDDTRERLKPYADRIRYVYQHNQGVAAARNRGIEVTDGDLVAFLDADDVWHPRKLELQVEAMERDPKLGLLGTPVYEWPADAAPVVHVRAASPRLVSWRQLVVRNRITTSSAIVRREALHRVGVFDPELRGPEDYDLWLRIAEQFPVATLDVPLVGYRTVAASLGRQPLAMEQGLMRILRKLDDRGAWKLRWLLRRKARSYVRYSCAYMYGASGNHATALRRVLASLAAYPLPYQSDEVRMPWARARMLTRLMGRWVLGRNARGGAA